MDAGNPDPERSFASILPTFPVKTKLNLLKSELSRVLKDHEMLMVVWADGVESLWMKTRSRGAANDHPWFDSIGSIKARFRPRHGDITTIDEAMERLGFEEEGLEGEDDDEVDSVDDYEDAQEVLQGADGVLE